MAMGRSVREWRRQATRIRTVRPSDVAYGRPAVVASIKGSTATHSNVENYSEKSMTNNDAPDSLQLIYDTVILGAGAGGLCTAARLVAAGKKVLVLESRDRVGGRASSEHIDGFTVNVGAIAIERGCSRMEWLVIDWNAPAIGFYQALGARAMDEWTVMRLDGAALGALGATAQTGARQA